MKTNTAPTFGEPTPLGLLGLAIGCAALLPIAFGRVPKEPAAAAMMFQTCAWLCLLFGAACQLLAGVMCFANKNTLGGTLLTTFSFNWVMNYFALDALAHGKMVDPTVIACVDLAFVVIFVALTYACARVSKPLFALLLDIDALYALRIARHLVPSPVLSTLIGVATLALAAIAGYIALRALTLQDRAAQSESIAPALAA